MAGFVFPGQRALDLVCLGRAGVDLYADEENLPLEAVSRFRKSVGGSPANVAVGAARLGLRTGMIGKVSGDGFGRYVRRFLMANAVDVRGLATDTGGALNSVAFAEVRPDECQVIIYRRGAADLQLQIADIDSDYIAGARALFVTGTALSAEPSREAALWAMDLAQRCGTVVVLDLDYRPYGWADSADASLHLRRACAMADIVIGNHEEFDVLGGGGAAQAQGAQRLLDGTTQAVVLKNGAQGCRVLRREGPVIEQGIYEVRARKPYGSGDAFAAALLWALLDGRPWHEAARLGAAAAAINVSRDACAEAMATQAELMAFVASHQTQPLRPATESST